MNIVLGNTVVIERPDRSVERVTRSCVTLAPQPTTLEEIHKATRPLTDVELTPFAYPTPEDINKRNIMSEPQPIREAPNKLHATQF